MKKLILAIGMLILAGCGRAYRTGTVCIVPFTTANFQTTDPIDVRQEVVDSIAIQIPPAIANKLLDNTQLKFATDCSKSDFTLSGRLHTVNTAQVGSSGLAFFGGRWNYSQRQFGLGIDCSAKDNKTGEIVMNYDDYKQDKNLQETIISMADDITEELNKDKKNSKSFKTVMFGENSKEEK